MDSEDLSEALCKCTFQNLFQVPIETRQTQTNPEYGAVEDLTTFWGPYDLSLMSVDYFATMVLLNSHQVGVANLKHPEFGMNDASIDDFNLEDRYFEQILSNAWPFLCNKIFQNAFPGLKYRLFDEVTKATQIY